jgi:hypothetical protein
VSSKYGMLKFTILWLNEDLPEKQDAEERLARLKE